MLGELTRRIDRFGVCCLPTVTGACLWGTALATLGLRGTGVVRGGDYGADILGWGMEHGLVPQRELRVLEPPSASPTAGRNADSLKNHCTDRD